MTATQLESIEPLKVARQFLRSRFTSERALTTLIFWRDAWWHWEHGWLMRSEAWIQKSLWEFLEDATYEKVMSDGSVAFKRYAPNRSKVSDVCAALEGVCLIDDQQGAPFWLQPDERPLDSRVAFRDVLVDVAQSGCDEDGTWEWHVEERTEKHFDVVPGRFDFDPDAECPLWERTVAEWSGQDENWVELLRRWIGYCMLGHRRYAKWLLMHGKIRGGKGTIGDIVWALMGSPGYIGLSLEDLTDNFGMDGVEFARVVDIREVSKAGTAVTERGSRILKNIVGGDPQTVNVKHVRQRRGVVLKAAPMMQCNEIPVLPNEGRGLTGKMLVLPFIKSFEGKENWNLKEDLKRELPGIAVWALQGAVRLEQERDHQAKWPIPRRSQETVRRYHLQNNPFDQFLEARFVQRANGFLPTEAIWNLWSAWKRENQVAIQVSRNRIRPELLRQSSWEIEEAREAGTGRRGVRGLMIRSEHQDDL